MNLMPFFVAWAGLAVVVIGLAVMRKTIAAKEDDTLHLAGDASAVVDQQTVIAKKLEAIDKWGKILTVVLVLTGIVLGGFYGMEMWNATSKVGLQ